MIEPSSYYVASPSLTYRFVPSSVSSEKLAAELKEYRAQVAVEKEAKRKEKELADAKRVLKRSREEEITESKINFIDCPIFLDPDTFAPARYHQTRGEDQRRKVQGILTRTLRLKCLDCQIYFSIILYQKRRQGDSRSLRI